MLPTHTEDPDDLCFACLYATEGSPIGRFPYSTASVRLGEEALQSFHCICYMHIARHEVQQPPDYIKVTGLLRSISGSRRHQMLLRPRRSTCDKYTRQYIALLMFHQESGNATERGRSRCRGRQRERRGGKDNLMDIKTFCLESNLDLVL